MKVVIISQARMGSSRLPGKVLRVAAGRTLLEHHLARLQRCTEAQEIVVATSTQPADDAIVALCDRLGVASHRGSESDVLSRYSEAARRFSADVVVRVTSDCPLIDPAVVDDVIRHYRGSSPSFDYVSNVGEPRSFPRGLDTEVFSSGCLYAAEREATDPLDREHVTRFIRSRPDRFRCGEVRCAVDLSAHRWTVDTAEDFDLVSRLLGDGGCAAPPYSLEQVLANLRRHPEWMAINSHVQQKKT